MYFQLQLTADGNYPSYVCSMCLSMLNLSYRLIVQFEKSQKLLEKYFTKHGLKNNRQIRPENESEEINRHEEPSDAPVELILGENKFDVKDILIIEDEKQDDNQFDGFLKNLGTEISASFVKSKSQKSKPNVVKDNHSVTIIKKNVTADKDNFSSGNIRGLLKANRKTIIRTINRKQLPKQVQQNNHSFLCQFCGRLFKTKSAFYHHTVAKHQDRKFECEECGKKYLSAGHLRQHNLVHTNVRSHLCNICGKSFIYSNALIYHMRIHTGEKKYKCTFCDKSFRMPCTQKRHIRTHTGMRPYNCKYCDKAFGSKGEVNCHEMLHTGYRPYHCKYCGKGFTKTHNLKLHILGHTGPYVCDMCNKTFIENEYLRMHIKAAHADVAPSGAEDTLCSS